MTTLATVQVTTAQSAVAQTAVTGLGKPQALSLQAIFTYVASAATSCDAYIQTSLDGGTTWYDIANFHFTTASAVKYQNVSGMTAVNASVAMLQASITNDTSINGVIGDRLRVVITSVGTYGSGTSVVVNAYAR